MKVLGVFALLAAFLGILYAATVGVRTLGGDLPGPWNFPDAAPTPGGRAIPMVQSIPAVRDARLLGALGDPAASGMANWPGQFDAAPKAFDFDGDGVVELSALSNDTFVYVFNATSGRVLARLPTHTPPGWYIERVLNGVEAAVLRPGEPPSLVVTNHAAFVTVWRFNASQSTPDSFAFEKAWEKRADDCFWNPGMDAKPTVADVTGDGVQEILVQTEETGLFALTADGDILWHWCWGGGNAEPVVADLRGDGSKDVIFASDSGLVVVLNGPTGQPQWSFDAGGAAYGIKPASISVSPTVAELDGKPPLEVVFSARHAPSNDSTQFGTFHLALFAVHENLATYKVELFWMRQPQWAHPLSYTHLVVEDVDRDGRADILGMDWNTVGHMPGNWEALPLAHLFRLTERGEDVWVRDIDTWWSNKDIALADVDSDGAPEVLLNGAHQGADGVWVVSADTGAPRGFVSAGTWRLMRGPQLVDVDGDAKRELLFPVEPNETRATRGAILVFSLP
ncbi:MAG: VCBS repeat-containing protein [Euryarchaeota archaeon]|nr:VCBS repeat-containing protein [Euryarchaeota archaeon]